MSNQNLLIARNLTRTLPLTVPVRLVNDLSFSADKGEFISITGPSGSGKSSLLYLLGLLDLPDSGELFIAGQNTAQLGDKERSKMRLTHIGFVFQFHFLLEEFSVLENITIPMRRLGALAPEKQRARALEILDELGINEHAGKKPSQLSGGQRQRVAVARAIANNPPLLLADEPTGNLDSKNSRIVHDILKALARDKGTCVIMVTHDTELAADTDRNIHLVDGAVATDKAQNNSK
jgi:lipoprotein-releasing system ATP-binding protein